jgi:hypothetical protein
LKKDTGGLNPISIPTSVELDTSTGAISRRIMSLVTMHLAAIRAYCSPMHRRGPIPKLALEKHPENLFPSGIFQPSFWTKFVGVRAPIMLVTVENPWDPNDLDSYVYRSAC